MLLQMLSLDHFFMAITQPYFQLLTQIREAVAQDTQLRVIMQLCLQNQSPHPNYSVTDNLLLWKGRLVILHKHALITTILQELHNTPLGGHSVYTRTLKWVTTQFY